MILVAFLLAAAQVVSPAVKFGKVAGLYDGIAIACHFHTKSAFAVEGIDHLARSPEDKQAALVAYARLSSLVVLNGKVDPAVCAALRQ